MPDITTLFNGSDGATRANFNEKLTDINAHGNDGASHITTVPHTKTGTTHNLTVPTGAKNLTFLATADFADGDTWTITTPDGAVKSVTAVLQNGEPLPGELFKSGCWVTGIRLSDDGAQLGFRSGAATVPSIFGNGSDGDAVIDGTVTLPVPVPHQSIVEMQYKSLTINAGAILKAAAHNAGLIIRVKGDLILHGTIDQSGLAPKTNPQSNYPYPAQLVCGDGGNGGKGGASSNGRQGGEVGIGMLKRAYGGGYGAGGSGAGSFGSGYPGAGGNSTGTIVSINDIFVGGLGITGSTGTDIAGSGLYGGGGGAPGSGDDRGGNGASGAGGAGENAPGYNVGGGGGAGNYGGGVIILYVGGTLLIDGLIKCNGLSGGRGGNNQNAGGTGGGGGGGGGGAIYIYYGASYTNTGLLQVNGGSGGATGTDNSGDTLRVGTAGSAGSVGSITVIKHTN